MCALTVLGPRPTDCTQLVLDVDGKTARDIFASPDDMKFHSRMTLCAYVPVFLSDPASKSSVVFSDSRESGCDHLRKLYRPKMPEMS